MKYVGHISVPVYELEQDKREMAGLRQNMLTAGPHAVSTGGGLGSDAVWAELETGKRHIYRYVTGRDVLTAVAQLVKHPDADRFPRTENYDRPT